MTAGRYQGGRLAGVGVLLFGLMALLATLWLINPGDHPLAGTVELPLCERLDEEALKTLLGNRDLVIHREVPMSAAHGEACRLTFTSANASTPLPGVVWLSLMTTAQMRLVAGMRSDTRRHIEVYVTESRASGMQPEPVTGPWREAWLMRKEDGSAVLIAEDRGVILQVHTQKIPGDGLLPYSEQLALQLQQ